MMNSERELIDDAKYAIGKLKEELESSREELVRLGEEISNPPDICTGDVPDLRKMSNAERETVFQLRSAHELRLQRQQGLRKRIDFVTGEIESWEDRIVRARKDIVSSQSQE
ncbi:hypothetical protein [Thalassospira lucentensis]|uniref:hypothetical protein n=1 Tax=Thalassospira lucentensis TaxID=168935 RepID=UPI00294315B6|nr:hypothetical protein [Thalassospira lucentensis]WOI09037.1 hypothetical protein R1T41_00140 [Thalassospira lucentensis]